MKASQIPDDEFETKQFPADQLESAIYAAACQNWRADAARGLPVPSNFDRATSRGGLYWEEAESVLVGTGENYAPDPVSDAEQRLAIRRVLATRGAENISQRVDQIMLAGGVPNDTLIVVERTAQ